MGLRVLYVEDDDESRDLTSSVLTLSGHAVAAVALAADALVLATRGGFDVALVDLSLPDGDGWELAHALKQRCPGLPVALLTGWGATVNPAEARRRGVDAVLVKPVRADLLRERLETLTARRVG